VEALLGPVKQVWSVLTKIANISFDAIIGAIKSVVDWIKKIDWPSPPGWLKKIPGVGGLSVPLAAGFAPRGIGAAATASGGVAASSALTINVFGAIDAEGTARQIRQLLEAHDRRHGRIA
jgi:hypothetical protein